MADLYAVIKGQQPNGRVTPLAATATVLATGVLTSDNTNVSVGDQVVIGPNAYVFVSSITSYGEVLIGTSADGSLTNLAARINAADAPFNVVTSSGVISHAVTVTAVDDGTGGASGNQLITTTTSAHLSWGAATLTGGVAGILEVTGPSGGGIPIVITPTTVTPNFFAVTTTSPVVIPIGAIDSSVLILTGTGTLNTVDQPVGVPWTEPNKLAATVTLVLASASSARVYYGT